MTTKSEKARAELAEQMVLENGSIEVEVGNNEGRVPYLTLRKFATDNKYELTKIDVGLWSVTDTSADEDEDDEDTSEFEDSVVEVIEDLTEDEEYEDEDDEDDELAA